MLAFDVQYWNGSSWVTVPGGSVTGNDKVWRKFTFSAITTSKIRVYINTVPDAWSRVVEIQAFGTSAGGEKVQWLVPDHLGTPRIIVDETGSRANVKRHDYLPFGEELFAGTGGRTSALGYAGDGVRQQFTGYERDIESGLDLAGARFYSSIQGRFTSIDPLAASALTANPQTFNRYSYVTNSPLTLVDPTGMFGICPGGGQIGQGGVPLGSFGGETQSEEQQPTAQSKIVIDIGEPPPPLVSTVTFVVPEPQEYINLPTNQGTYFTGVGSILEVTARDAAGNAIKGISVTETVVSAAGTPVSQRTTPAPVGADGSFTDLVGVGLTPLPFQPISQQYAGNLLGRIAQRPTEQITVQTLRFYAPEGYLLGISVLMRTFTNLDANGNVKPTTNSSGRPVDNYSTKVRLLTMLRPQP